MYILYDAGVYSLNPHTLMTIQFEKWWWALAYDIWLPRTQVIVYHFVVNQLVEIDERIKYISWWLKDKSRIICLQCIPD